MSAIKIRRISQAVKLPIYRDLSPGFGSIRLELNHFKQVAENWGLTAHRALDHLEDVQYLRDHGHDELAWRMSEGDERDFSG